MFLKVDGMKKILLLCLFVLSAFGTQLAFADYTLGTGDYVKVVVYGDDHLTREIRVADKGILTFPLIGEVAVEGLTTVEAERRIAALLQSGGFMTTPQVSVVVTQFMSKTVSVLGGVLKPGRYPVTRKSNILDMIAEAGGLNAEGSEIVTFVRGNAQKTYDMSEIVHLKVDAGEIEVVGGETIYVGTKDVSVVGQVSRPGKFSIQGGARRLTDFLSLAGGVVESAGDTIVYSSKASGVQVTEQINIEDLFSAPESALNKVVQPGDIVYVPKAPQVYVYGEVQRPGVYKIEKKMSVMQAIAKAGGLTIRGTQRSAKLHRKNQDGTVAKMSPDLTTILVDEDVLFIEESLL